MCTPRALLLAAMCVCTATRGWQYHAIAQPHHHLACAHHHTAIGLAFAPWLHAHTSPSSEASCERCVGHFPYPHICKVVSEPADAVSQRGQRAQRNHAPLPPGKGLPNKVGKPTPVAARGCEELPAMLGCDHRAHKLVRSPVLRPLPSRAGGARTAKVHWETAAVAAQMAQGRLTE